MSGVPSFTFYWFRGVNDACDARTDPSVHIRGLCRFFVPFFLPSSLVIAFCHHEALLPRSIVARASLYIDSRYPKRREKNESKTLSIVWLKMTPENHFWALQSTFDILPRLHLGIKSEARRTPTFLRQKTSRIYPASFRSRNVFRSRRAEVCQGLLYLGDPKTDRSVSLHRAQTDPR